MCPRAGRAARLALPMLGLIGAAGLLGLARAEPPFSPTEGDGGTQTIHRSHVPGLSFDPNTGGARPRLVAALKQRPLFEFVSPVATWAAVTDRFGAPRKDGAIHGGIDLALDGTLATPVMSACSGAVSEVGLDSGYGNFVVVDCGWGWSALVAHLSRVDVERGQVVGAGAQVGISGSTGYSTGEHVHFEVWYRGERLNPEFVLDFGIPEGARLSSGPIEEESNEGAVDPADVSEVAPIQEGPVEEPTTGVTATPSPTAADTPEPSPTGTPSASPTGTPSSSPTGTATPTPSPAPTASPTVG